MVIVHRWKEAAIKARGCGFVDVQCAQAASVSLGQLQRELSDDPDFKAAYDAAYGNGKKVQW
jgi:hypothetical protein